VSSQATLAVHDDGPDIVDQPDSLNLCTGQTASFSVSAVPHMGSPLTYQWRLNGDPITGAVFPTLSFVTTGSEAGQYDCVVTEYLCGSNTSTPAILTLGNDPPVITLVGASELTIECHSGTYAELGATALDDCDGAIPVAISGQTVNPDIPGTYIVRYNAMDSQGNPALEVTRTVTVQDTIPPVITLATATGVLWSPNHEMINVGLTAIVSDACDPAASVATVRVFSDEVELPDTGDGTGRHSPDAKDAGVGTLRLRSERRNQGLGNGRVYLIVASATDASGNTAFGFATVVCPNANSLTSLDEVTAEALTAKNAAIAATAGATDVGDVTSILTSLGWVQDGLAAEYGPNQ
jgi:hypothetical protein